MAELRNTKMRIEIPSGENEKGLGRKEIKELVENAAKDGIDTVKIIGTEPIENPEIVKIIKDIARIEGIKDISIATKGKVLEPKAQQLKEAGLSRVTFNLDTLLPIRYVGGDINDVVKGINAATDNGLKPVKINVLLQKGYNDDEIMDYVQLTFQHEYEIRFIEMTEEEEAASKYDFMSCEEVKAKLPALRPAVLDKDGNLSEDPRCGIADVYKYPGARGKICFIAKRAEDFEERTAAVFVK